MARINKLTDLYPLMEPELPSCPEPLILQALRKKTRQFCQDTDTWREQLQDIALVAGQRDYVLNSSFDAEIRKIVEVRIRQSPAADYDGILVDHGRYVFHGELSQRSGVNLSPNTLTFDATFIPSYNVVGGLMVKVSLAPFLMAGQIDQDFLQKWCEAIIGGAMFYLMTMKGKKWTDPQKAGLYLVDYNKGISRARRENVVGQNLQGGDLEG